jgi:chromate reductase, NAD(P)H dehydrogenase (quinone)
MNILAISGSLRAASHNTALLRAAAEHAPEGVEIELFEGLDRVPPYNEDHDTDIPPVEVERLRDEIRAADGVLISTPEYNGSIPGQLKNLIDWASRPRGTDAALYGKPVAVLGASPSDYGALWAQDHLRKALGIAGARVLEHELVVGKVADRFGDDGALIDPEIREGLVELTTALHDHHRALAAVA